MTCRILVVTRSFGGTSSKPGDVLPQCHREVVATDMSQKMTEERLIEALQGIEGAIIGVVPMNARVLEHGPDLKVVSLSVLFGSVFTVG